MKFLLSVLLLTTVFSVALHANDAPADTHAADRAQIQQLIEHFKGAILAKNGSAMHDMFMPGASWLMGFDKASLAKIRIKKPEAKQFVPDNYEQFAKFVGSTTKPIEEVFDNVQIQTDGTVGVVYFDYRFLVEGKITNHGVETWQLIHTNEGWKISAMLYSVTLDDTH